MNKKPLLRTIYLSTIAGLASLLEKPWLRWLHTPFQGFQIHVVIPILFYLVKYKFHLDSKFQLLGRHSVTETGEYNFLYSDLDLSIILSQDQISESFSISKYFSSLKLFFPFLGEIEIYTPEEHQRLQAELESSRLYQTLRHFRKISWTVDEASTLPSRYHSDKRQRALRKIYRRLGIDPRLSQPLNWTNVQERLEKIILNEFPQISCQDLRFGFSVPYLGVRLQTEAPSNSTSDRTITMSSSAALILLSVIPINQKTTPIESPAKEEIEKLRLQPEIFLEWQSQMIIESLILKAVDRARPNLFPWIGPWVQELNSIIKTKV